MSSLEGLLYTKLTSDADLIDLLAKFDSLPAVFIRQAPGDRDPKWSESQYPRLDYNVIRLEDGERKIIGTVAFHIWGKRVADHNAEIDVRLRTLIDGTAFHPDDEPIMVTKWLRSDAFDIMGADGQLDEYTIGMSVVFEVMAFPDQSTFEPDPIATLQDFISTVFAIPATVTLRDSSGVPVLSLVSKLIGSNGNMLRAQLSYVDATKKLLEITDDGDVIWSKDFPAASAPGTLDEGEKLTQSIILGGGSDYFYGQWQQKGDGILQIGDFPFEGGADSTLQSHPSQWDTSLGTPLVYFRLGGVDSTEWFSWGAWVVARIFCHIITPSSSDRLYWIKRVVEKLVNPRLQFGDTSTLDLTALAADPSADQFRTGQIRMAVRFGIDNRPSELPLIERGVVAGVGANAMPVPEETNG